MGKKVGGLNSDKDTPIRSDMPLLFALLNFRSPRTYYPTDGYIEYKSIPEVNLPEKSSGRSYVTQKRREEGWMTYDLLAKSAQYKNRAGLHTALERRLIKEGFVERGTISYKSHRRKTIIPIAAFRLIQTLKNAVRLDIALQNAQDRIILDGFNEILEKREKKNREIRGLSSKEIRKCPSEFFHRMKQLTQGYYSLLNTDYFRVLPGKIKIEFLRQKQGICIAKLNYDKEEWESIQNQWKSVIPKKKQQEGGKNSIGRVRRYKTLKRKKDAAGGTFTIESHNGLLLRAIEPEGEIALGVAVNGYPLF